MINDLIIRKPVETGEDISETAWMSVHLPENPDPNRTAVIICPGGGYVGLADQHEGIDCAAWMNEIGVTAFILRYRLAPKFHHPCQLNDVQWAVRYARANANDFGIDASHIGVWGFSAGGHLASTAATHFDYGDQLSNDPVQRASSRPNFAILAYPVISFVEFTHSGSRANLLGDYPDENLYEYLSSELQVTENTPPAFLFHTDSDNGVSSENSVLFYLALRRAGIPAEMHIFEQGPHGVGLAPEFPMLSGWKYLLKNWMITRGLIES